MKTLIAAAVVALGLLAMPQAQAQAQTAQDYYRSAYFLLGSYLRAGNVCDSKKMIEFGFSFVSSKEFRAFSAAYPKTYKQWMMEGGQSFNSMVMKDGIPAACRTATDMMTKNRRR